MKVKRLEFELSKIEVTEDSPIWKDLLIYLEANRFQVLDKNIYRGKIKQGYIETTGVIADNKTELERFCRLYNPKKV
jgi:hypothetical protein